MDDIVTKLNCQHSDLCHDDADCIEWQAKRIAKLEAEVLRLGDVLNATPSLALMWPHEGSRPTIEFATKLLSDLHRVSREVITNSIYHDLYKIRSTRELSND